MAEDTSPDDAMICPKCGKRTMVRQRTRSGEYKLICRACGTERGKFKKDRGIDVI